MRLTRLAVIGIPLLLALMLGWQLASGRIYFYIHDRSVWLVALSVPLLGALGLIELRQRVGSVAARNLSLVALPLLVAVLVPARPLGSAAVQAQSAQAGGSGSSLLPSDVSVPVTLDSAGRTWDLKQLGLLQLTESDQSQLDGQRADLLGFVYRTEGLRSDEFLVGRFVVRCCTADAVAINFPVRYDRSADLSRDSWVDVQGTIRATPGQIPFLEAESVTAVPEPGRPYLQLP